MRKKGIKLKWRLGEKPTGRFKSFHKRGWPSAEYADGSPAASIAPEDNSGYWPNLAETTVLITRVADRAGHTFVWRRLTARPVGVKAAKLVAQEFIDKYHDKLWDTTQSIVARKRD